MLGRIALIIGFINVAVAVADTPFNKIPIPIIRPITPATSLIPSTTELDKICIHCFVFVIKAVIIIVTIKLVSAFHLKKNTSTIGNNGINNATGFTDL